MSVPTHLRNGACFSSTLPPPASGDGDLLPPACEDDVGLRAEGAPGSGWEEDDGGFPSAAAAT